MTGQQSGPPTHGVAPGRTTPQPRDRPAPPIPRGANCRARDGTDVALMDLPTAAAVLGTTPRHVRGLIRERGLPFVKVGQLVRIDEGDLCNWITANRKVLP